MALVIKLKYIDDLEKRPEGRKRFRKRWPKDVGEALGESFMQRPMDAREGAALVAERENLLKEFDATVAKHRRSQEERDSMTPRQLWAEAQEEAKRLTRGIVGDVEGAMDALADEAQRKGDERLYRAIVAPDDEENEPTLADAFDRYEKFRLDGNQRRDLRNTVKRLRRRAGEALGPINKLRLADLRWMHGQRMLEALKAIKSRDGKPLKADTVSRELSILAAVVERGLREFDLTKVVDNPFRKLDVKKPGEAPEDEKENRIPMSPEIIAEVRNRLTTKAKRTELILIWRLCEGTGARPGEIAGLRVEDVYLDHETPHVRLEWHEDSRKKNKTSIRWVPLIGDALEAAREAVKAAKGETLLFDHYARESGADRLSAIMNKHIRAVTHEPRHVFYSLRHGMKDKLITSGADARLENLLMGHTTTGMGDRVYGSKEARLKVAAEVLRKAVEG